MKWFDKLVEWWFKEEESHVITLQKLLSENLDRDITEEEAIVILNIVRSYDKKQRETTLENEIVYYDDDTAVFRRNERRK